MRELYLMADESTEKFFVLRDSEGVSFQIARSEFAPLFSPAAEQTEDGEESAESAPLVAVEEGVVDVEKQEPEAPAEHDDTPEYSALSKQRGLPEPDPLLTNPLTMPPREIQARIRAGATSQELADEMGVAVSRVDTYSHPVVLERMQIAEAAKQSHPVRDDGPAKLTLFEILATAFAARGHALSDAEWDATREPGEPWVVHLRWRAGLTENEAQWTLKRSMGSPASTEARNSVAADLTDPDFVQPVRSLTAVDAHGEDDWDGSASPAREESAEADGAEDAQGTEGTVTEGDFLRHPDGEQPQKRRRKAVTPHWEDVLLGVRTNTKRPRK
ncbi:septation protein SepH [uncultured Corynebacterium sp.]|uniref:septation protein SepH n=1 Tax=uncultured Corynebacterium sp. TaxID=159447 RepID=UPI00261EB86D|nr:septation protein SepH [uncultured Corynebacterium sp.]